MRPPVYYLIALLLLSMIILPVLPLPATASSSPDDVSDNPTMTTTTTSNQVRRSPESVVVMDELAELDRIDELVALLQARRLAIVDRFVFYLQTKLSSLFLQQLQQQQHH